MLNRKGVKGNLLIVDDDLLFRQAMDALLTREGYKVRCAPNGQMALMFAREDPPELILLDIRLPDMDGFQVCRRLKEDSQTSNIPVIFISGLDEVVDKVKGFVAGGVDYITKPFQSEELLARVETHLSLRRLQEQIEAQNAQLQQEITKSKLAEEKIKQAAEEWRTTFDSIKIWFRFMIKISGLSERTRPLLLPSGWRSESFSVKNATKSSMQRKSLGPTVLTEKPWGVGSR